MSGDGDGDAWMSGLKGRMRSQKTVHFALSPPSPSSSIVDAPQPPPLRASLTGLPEELIIQICEGSRSTLPALRLTCRYLHTVTTPILFRSIRVADNQRMDEFYGLLNGERSYRFLGPSDDTPEHLKSLWGFGCMPVTDIVPGPNASTTLMHSVRHLSIGPRNRGASLPLDLRYVLQLLPCLRVLEIFDEYDRILNHAARVLRAYHKHTIERFVYLGPCLTKFATRNPFARAFGDSESLRELDVLNTTIGNAPWIYPTDVGVEEDWNRMDDEVLGIEASGTVWYRPQLMFPEGPVRLPSRLTSLRLRNVEFEPPEPATPPEGTIARLREHAPHLLGMSAKGKEKEIGDKNWNEWPPALLPVARLVMCSPRTLTELGIEGLVGGAEVLKGLLYAVREIGPQLRSLRLRRCTNGKMAIALLELCPNVTHVLLDRNGEMSMLPVLRALPGSTRRLELWPPYVLRDLAPAIKDGVLTVRHVDVTSSRWRLPKSLELMDGLRRAYVFGRARGVDVDLGACAPLLGDGIDDLTNDQIGNETELNKIMKIYRQQDVEAAKHYRDDADE